MEWSFLCKLTFISRPFSISCVCLWFQFVLINMNIVYLVIVLFRFVVFFCFIFSYITISIYVGYYLVDLIILFIIIWISFSVCCYIIISSENCGVIFVMCLVVLSFSYFLVNCIQLEIWVTRVVCKNLERWGFDILCKKSSRIPCKRFYLVYNSVFCSVI